MRRRQSRQAFAALSAKSARSAPTGIGSLFRSEEMLLIRFYLDRAAAHCTVDELGDLGMCQFNDLNDSQSSFQRAFSNNIRRCDEMLRIARFLAEQVERVPELTLAPPPERLSDSPAADIRLDDLDAHLQSLERSLLELNANEDALLLQYNQTRELRAVLDKCADFFRDAPQAVAARPNVQLASAYRHSDPLLATVLNEFAALSETPSIAVLEPDGGGLNVEAPLSPAYGNGNGNGNGAGNGHGYANGAIPSNGTSTRSYSAGEVGGVSDGAGGVPWTGNGGLGKSGLLSFLTGTLAREKVASFERLLFRVSHGNCIVRFADIKEELVDPETGESMVKSVFMVFFAGAAIKMKITKICDSFAANRYTVPEDHGMQMIALDQCGSRLGELKSVSSITVDQRKQTLVDVASVLGAWQLKLKREMSIFHTLNMLNYDTSTSLFIAEAWCPVSAEGSVREALELGRQRSNAQVASVLEVRKPDVHVETPPTHFKTNKFTSVFQSIVESYGVAKYQEANPAPYAIITFPFLFAVMFGDIGHGIVMSVFAAYLVANEARLGASRRRLNEMMVACFDGRYLILMMGLFSVYTGLIYNEFFAVPLDLFGSRWKYTAASTMACGIDNCGNPGQVLPPLEPYPIGFDPIWKASKTGLVFFNSYKMKLSIVLGVAQMVMGIAMSYTNARFFREPLDVWYVFVPQMGFMLSIFGYLVILILYKWQKDFGAAACLADPMCLPPDLKSVLISMVMSPGSMPKSMVMFSGQNELQLGLVCFAAICIPWMLLPKPLILRARHSRSKRRGGSYEGIGDVDVDDVGKDVEFDFGEVFVHQMIHTIEFVLGAVSNTASYLRLWALSLAHAELSNVFLEKLLFGSIASGSAVLMVIGFFMWVAMTLGVLLFMESLSAFLHALRLHWVEFQNKFYLLHGDGKKFEPFDHANICVDAHDG